MYESFENGTVIDIQGLKCNIPPEGYVFNIISKQLEYIGVYSRSDNPEEQYWERLALPTWYKDVMKLWEDYEKKKKEDDDDFYDIRLEEFKRQEWKRRLNGFWYKKKGKSIYLTGLHYLYMQWWSIDIGYPKYRTPDLEYFYFLQYCIEDDNCMGMLEVTKRRFGKTYRGGIFVTDYTTRTKMTNGTLQSKTGPDAKKVFTKAIVNPFRRLPKFFRPEYDMSLGVNPKTEMRFEKTNVRGKKANDNVDKDELGSTIMWYSADPLAQDGQKVHRAFQDEWAKTTECDIYERHEVMRYCVVDDEGNIIGKLLYASTVEKLESEKAGVQDGAKKLWDDSDQNNKGENGRTPSGLYRFFMSAKRAKNFDIYGEGNEEKTLKEILADRESVKNNPRSLAARIRKEPITIGEAFMEDGEKCIFNITNIVNREAQLAENTKFKREVLFWRDPETQKVKWRDIQRGEEDFCWRITHFPPTGEDNQYTIEDKLRKPSRVRDGAIAVDSYSNSQGGRKYGSKASAWIGRRYSASDPDNTKKAIGHLYGRPKEKDELHEQVLLAAEFYGYQVWFEHNSDSYDSYFRDRGRRNYLGLYPINCIEPSKRETTDRHRGVPTTPFSLTTQHDTGIAYFENDIERIDFEEVLQHAKKFDPYERTKFDTVVAFLMLLVVLQEPIIIPQSPKAPLVRVYPNNGAIAI